MFKKRLWGKIAQDIQKVLSVVAPRGRKKAKQQWMSYDTLVLIDFRDVMFMNYTRVGKSFGNVTQMI